jgi:hypothetical protein
VLIVKELATRLRTHKSFGIRTCEHIAEVLIVKGLRWGDFVRGRGRGERFGGSGGEVGNRIGKHIG